MGKASAAAALVAPARPTQRLAPGTTGTLPPAIPLAAVAAAAHPHLHAAAGTGECAGIARLLALPRSTHRRLALQASTSPRQPASAWTNTDARCHTAPALAATYARVGRGGFTACASRFGRRARLATSHGSTPSAALPRGLTRPVVAQHASPKPFFLVFLYSRIVVGAPLPGDREGAGGMGRSTLSRNARYSLASGDHRSCLSCRWVNSVSAPLGQFR